MKSRKTATTTASGPANSVPMKNEEAGMPMGGVGAPTYTQQPGPEYTNNQAGPQGGYTAQPMQHQGGPPQLPVPQEQYPGSQYPQGQTQYPQAQAQHSPNPANYPNPTLYPQGEQAPAAQSYPSPQSEHPPQYAGSAPQQASYPGPRDGVSEMHSPTETPQANNPHHV